MILLLCWFMLTITTSSVNLVDEQKYDHENRFCTNIFSKFGRFDAGIVRNINVSMLLI